MDECTLGTHNCDGNATCTNKPGGWDCTCNNGWAGSGTSCADVDECLNNPCNANASCENTVGGFVCDCNPGYEGNGFSCLPSLGSDCTENAQCASNICTGNGVCCESPCWDNCYSCSGALNGGSNGYCNKKIELCDGEDNNCDGEIDNLTSAPYDGIPKTGVCAGLNLKKVCMGVDGWQHPDYASVVPDYEATDASCDGVDNNCNGTNDEGYGYPDTTCGLGVCMNTGFTQCINGEIDVQCTNYATTKTTDPDCNNLDDDCDGDIDEDYNETTTCGEGACAATAALECVGGAVIDNCQPGDPTAEVCDGFDNDCDGLTDGADDSLAACDDNDPNTKDDFCNDGTCAGVAYQCTPTQCQSSSTPNGTGCDVTYKIPSADCDDGFDNTKDDACDANGQCVGIEYQ